MSMNDNTLPHTLIADARLMSLNDNTLPHTLIADAMADEYER